MIRTEQWHLKSVTLPLNLRMIGANQILVGQRRWNSKMPIIPSSSMWIYLNRRSVSQFIFQKAHHQVNWYEYTTYIQEIKYQTKPYTQDLPHYNKNHQQGMISSSLILDMGSCTSSFYTPSARTLVNRAVFWISGKLHWTEIEISDHQRSIVKTTVTWDRQKTPAVSLRQRVQSRMNEDPNTIGIIWKSPGDMMSAITITMEHI